MPLFPEITPFKTGRFPLTDGHAMHYELSGNPKGTPVVVLHGGPGSSSSPKHRQLANPKTSLIITYDQRGCGQSTYKDAIPKGGLKANTTQQLVADLERLRKHLKLESWVVTGGSWGSTLALAYAEAHPKVVKGLVLSAIFLGTRRGMEWLFGPDGVARFYPNEYAALREVAGNPKAGHLQKALLKILTGKDKKRAKQAAVILSYYQLLACEVTPDHAEMLKVAEEWADAIPSGAILLHYDVNDNFLKPDQLLKNIHRIAHIPLHIIHGANDLICPPESAYALHAAHPNSTLAIIPTCGHSANEEAKSARVKALKAVLKR